MLLLLGPPPTLRMVKEGEKRSRNAFCTDSERRSLAMTTVGRAGQGNTGKLDQLSTRRTRQQSAVIEHSQDGTAPGPVTAVAD